MDAETMRRNGDSEQSIYYWTVTRQVFWNGEAVLVQAPARSWPVSQEDEE